MIGFLLPLILRLGVPDRLAKSAARGVLVIGAAVLLVGGFRLWLHFHDNAVVKADRNAANAEAATTARQADERAERASDSTREGIEDGNDRAREAARDSDDPLADGLRSLRPKTD